MPARCAADGACDRKIRVGSIRPRTDSHAPRGMGLAGGGGVDYT